MADVAGSDVGGFVVRDAAPCSRFLIQGPAPRLALAREAGRALETPEYTALWLGPDEWLLLASTGSRIPHAAAASVVDVSFRQLGLDLCGPAAADALATCCPLDLHEAGFPPGMCARTVFARAEIVLWRRGRTAFRVEIGRSFAPYLRGLLGLAALEFSAGG
jgi:sarcosine oxidase subunit gamma